MTALNPGNLSPRQPFHPTLRGEARQPTADQIARGNLSHLLRPPNRPRAAFCHPPGKTTPSKELRKTSIVQESRLPPEMSSHLYVSTRHLLCPLPSHHFPPLKPHPHLLVLLAVVVCYPTVKFLHLRHCHRLDLSTSQQIARLLPPLPLLL